MAQASALIEGNQPGKALALLEPEVKKHNNPTLLAIAGVAALWLVQRAFDLSLIAG